MNKTRKRSFTALLFVLASLFVLVLSLGIFCACDGNETADVGENANGTWYYGVTAPSAELGKNGDHYLNTETLTAYAKTADGTWQSTALYSGAEAPDASAGETGDLYLDTKNGVLYQKGDTLWSIVLTLKGTPGRDGVVWFSGEKDPEKDDPALADAQNGDFYLNTKEFTVWQLQEGVWTNLGGLTGAQGATGPAGPAGPAGPTGAQGTTGAAGKDGVDGKSAYELYVEQYKEAHGGSDADVLTEEQWLESLKGEKGDAGKDSVHFFYGEGVPQDNPAVAGAVEGDLYFGQFDGTDGTGKGSGSILYRFHNGKWDVLMESMTKGTISIFSLDKLIEFSELVAAGKIADGAEVHLKTDIDFNDAATVSVKARAAVMAIAATDWTPIGTEEHPFNGTFDGEGHIISNFTVEAKAGDVAGFFGKVDGATIENLHFENATVTATGTGAYGAVVAGEAKNDVTLHNVTVSGTVTATDDGAKVGSLVGKNDGGTVTTKDVEVTVSGIENTKDNFVGEGTDATVEGDYVTGSEVGEGFVKKTVYSAEGEPTGTVYEISSLDGLKTFRDSTNAKGSEKTYEGETIVLTTDIDLKDEETWTPIGSGNARFLGNFDGQNHTVRNLKIINDSKSNVYNLGFFGKVGSYNLAQSNVIKNLTIENVEMPATANPTEEKPHGKTDTTYTAGAFIGSAQVVNLENLTLKGDVYIAGKSGIGGIVGGYGLGMATDSAKRLSVTIQNITVDTTGTISASSKGCGAVIGALTRTMSTSGGSWIRDMNMSNIVVTGVTLKGTGEVGGIAGGGNLEKVNITIDGAKLTNVKILSAGLKSEVDTFGALISNEARRTDLASYVSTVSTFIFKNISGDVSVAKDSETEQYQAKQLNKGLIGALDTINPPTVTDDENITLQITWYGEVIGAE